MKLDPAVLPREVLDIVLKLAGRTDADVMGYATADEDVRLPSDVRAIRTGHHEAHAAGAFFTSPFDEAAVIVCDHHTEPSLSIWNAGPDGVRICRSVMGQGLASMYSACAGIFGFPIGEEEHHFEALARLEVETTQTDCVICGAIPMESCGRTMVGRRPSRIGLGNAKMFATARRLRRHVNAALGRYW